MYERVPHTMAIFALKTERMCHITGLEMVRAYGLRSQLWLLIIYYLLPPKGTAQALAIDPLRLKTLKSGTKPAFFGL